MPYLILADRDGEFDRRDLGGEAMVIGRALECDICIRDILLSRKHCRIEPFHDRWVVSDLGSKNGTHVGSELVTRHVLSDGDVIRIGRSQVCYKEGKFVPLRSTRPRRDVRPADPIEALQGTVCGFQVFDMEEDSRLSGFPVPRPRPAEPASYRAGEASAMVAELTSSAWDLMLSEPDVALLQRMTPRVRTLPIKRLAAPQPSLVPRARQRTKYVLGACAIGVLWLGVILVRSIFS